MHPIGLHYPVLQHNGWPFYTKCQKPSVHFNPSGLQKERERAFFQVDLFPGIYFPLSQTFGGD